MGGARRAERGRQLGGAASRLLCSVGVVQSIVCILGIAEHLWWKDNPVYVASANSVGTGHINWGNSHRRYLVKTLLYLSYFCWASVVSGHSISAVW